MWRQIEWYNNLIRANGPIRHIQNTALVWKWRFRLQITPSCFRQIGRAHQKPERSLIIRRCSYIKLNMRRRSGPAHLIRFPSMKPFGQPSLFHMNLCERNIEAWTINANRVEIRSLCLSLSFLSLPLSLDRERGGDREREREITHTLELSLFVQIWEQTLF